MYVKIVNCEFKILIVRKFFLRQENYAVLAYTRLSNYDNLIEFADKCLFAKEFIMFFESELYAYLQTQNYG